MSKYILDPETFSHFIDCPKCGWSFDPEFFDDHKCDQMGKGGDVLPTPDDEELK